MVRLIRKFVNFLILLTLYNNASVILKLEIPEVALINFDNYDNWALIVSTSRYWYNYRHYVNALNYYNFLKNHGFEDEKIILMLAENIPCNSRNSLPGEVYSEKDDLYYKLNVMTNTKECAHIDYKEDDVTVSNFIKILTGKHSYYDLYNRKLLTNENSHIFIFLTGHGGDGFLKFRDFEEIISKEISNSIEEMRVQKRYKKIFIISETCQASTLHKHINSEEVYAIGCSSLGESSYSKHFKKEIGVASIDRFTYYSIKELEKYDNNNLLSLLKFSTKYSKSTLRSTPELKYNSGKSDINRTYVNEFLFAKNKINFLESSQICMSNFKLGNLYEMHKLFYNSDNVHCFLFKRIFSLDDQNVQLIRIPSKCRFKKLIIKTINASFHNKNIFNPAQLINNTSYYRTYSLLFGLFTMLTLSCMFSYIF